MTFEEHEVIGDKINELNKIKNELNNKIPERQQKSPQLETLKDEEEKKDIDIKPKETILNKKHYANEKKLILKDIEKIEGQIKYKTQNGEANGKNKLSKMQLESLPTTREFYINKLNACEEEIKKFN